MRLFDTATGAVRPLAQREAGHMSMYVCGPTVYGPPHLGHGRMALVFDVLRRYQEWRGVAVTHVSNITDIDDKILERAAREGRDWRDITRRCEDVWYGAMDALGVARPHHDPHATAYVERMVALIDTLLADDCAYRIDDGVYFAAERVEGYGLLARQSLDSLRAGARVEAVAGKRSPVDFVLWKPARPGEPSWAAPWGAGRPGWHTECVVMSLDLLGDGFDLHGGGADLAFPHHENERAQAIASGHRFAGHWMHNGFVEVGGEKMSKSLGNVTNLVDLIERFDPRALRLLVLRSHYRSPIDVTGDALADATAALARLDAFARRSADLGGPASTDVLDAFVAAMDDDLDTPRAVAVVFDAVRAANAALDAGETSRAAGLAAAVATVAGALGLELRGGDIVIPDAVLARAGRRDQARAARDFATADAIRAELEAEGWTVQDTPQGTQVHAGRPPT